MLVILFVVQVARVLLNLVHAQALWVDLLGAEVECLEVTVELTLLLTVLVGDPDVLGRLTRGDVVPLGVMLTRVLLRRGDEVGVVHGLREHKCDLVPSLTCFLGQVLQLMLEVLQRLRPCRRLLTSGLEDVVDGFRSL